MFHEQYLLAKFEEAIFTVSDACWREIVSHHVYWMAGGINYVQENLNSKSGRNSS
jgi:hypothetical protein